jgi:hypothetical protein
MSSLRGAKQSPNRQIDLVSPSVQLRDCLVPRNDAWVCASLEV